MPYKVIYYKCPYCGEHFTSWENAVNHEEDCHKCNTCEHAYYVYGCEFNCEYSTKCNPPKYEHYIKQK